MKLTVKIASAIGPRPDMISAAGFSDSIMHQEFAQRKRRAIMPAGDARNVPGQEKVLFLLPPREQIPQHSVAILTRFPECPAHKHSCGCCGGNDVRNAVGYGFRVGQMHERRAPIAQCCLNQ